MSNQATQLDGSTHRAAGGRRGSRGATGRAVLVVLALAAVLAALVIVRVLWSPGPTPQADAGQAAPQDLVVKEADADSDSPAPLMDAGPVEIRVMAIGDMLMHEGVIASGRQEDGTYAYPNLFAPIAGDVAEADLAILNQETILGGSAWPYSGYPVFNSPQEVGDAEVEAGFDVVLKATNHTLDLGYDGVRSELAFWRDAHPQMAVIGAADPDGDGVCPAGGRSAAGPYLFEKEGFKLALLNYTDVLNGNVDPAYDPRVVSIASEEGIRADVAAARDAGADLVIVFMHWGEEYMTSPVESEHYWAGILQEAGVDAVIGGHPHVIQPVEVFERDGHQMLVCWSFGNFVSTQVGAENMVGGMVKLACVKDTDGARIETYDFIPTITQREGYTPYLTAYKLGDYTDDLAAASTIPAIDGGRGATVAWYVDYCASVLGEAFDRETLSVHGGL